METKTYIWLGVGIGGFLGSILGGILDHGNFFGIWGILLSTVGSVTGIFAGYKLADL